MSLREMASSWADWWNVFYPTVTSASPLDWPISYFFYIAIGAFLLLIIAAAISVFIFETLSEVTIKFPGSKYRDKQATKQALADIREETERTQRERRALQEHAEWRSKQKNQ